MPPRRAAAASPSKGRRADASPSPPPRSAAPLARRAAPGFFGRHGNIYIYVPNLIGPSHLLPGYARVAAVAGAFGTALESPERALALYFAAFVCDELDGRFARKFNQCTTFGAVLDMVTDRLSTTGLCLLLALMYPAHGLLFLAAICLDIGAHWVQMYASLLAHKGSHKDVSDCPSPLLRLYYSSRPFMGACCIGAEVFYMALLLLRTPAYRTSPGTGLALPEALVAALPPSPLSAVLAKDLSATTLLALVAAPLWLLKQWTNVLQGRFAAQRLAAVDSA